MRLFDKSVEKSPAGSNEKEKKSLNLESEIVCENYARKHFRLQIAFLFATITELGQVSRRTFASSGISHACRSSLSFYDLLGAFKSLLSYRRSSQREQISGRFEGKHLIELI